MPRMRVCVLLPALDAFKGGNHLPLLAACDAEFLVVCGKAKLDGALPTNIRVETLDVPLGSYYGGSMDARFAAALLRRHPPHDPFWKKFDVIHINQALHPSLLRLETSGVPVLYAVHHPVTADREVAIAESRTNPFAQLLWRWRYRRLCAWQKTLCRAAPHILTVSETVKKRLAADYGADRARITVVPNGVDGEEFHPPKTAPAFDVVAVGSFLHPRKGFPYLLAAYRALAAQHVRIADVGRRTQAQAAALGAIPGVTVHGTVPHDQLVVLLRSSSVLLSTALYEGFGLSLIEALACGHPAVAFGGGAVPEVLGAIDPSLVVPPRDTAALVARAREFLALPAAERARHAKQYRDAVLKRFGLAGAAKDLLRLYEGLAAR